jgi:hypothetical protein
LTRSNLTRLVGALLAVGFLVLAAALIRAPYGTERVFETGDPGDLYWDPSQATGSGARFVYEREGAPGLDFVGREVRGSLPESGDDLQRATAVRRWVRREIDYGSSSSDPKAQNLAADDILRDARRGVKSPCNRLAAVFVTACVAVGLPARMVHLSTGDGWGHFVAEVWLRDRRRWVMMDPSLNYFALLDGAPLDTLAIHRAVKSGVASRLVIERDGAQTLPDPYGTPFNKINHTFDYFRAFALVDRNDFLTHRTKLAPYTLLVWREGSGAAHPIGAERARLFALAAVDLALGLGAAWALTRPSRTR